jgi:regulatory protein
MAVITELTAVPKPLGRVAVEVDGEPLTVVPVEVVSRLGLAVSAPVSDDVLVVLADEGAALKTYDRALRLLAARGRSIRELRRRLLAAKAPEAHVEAALERLEAMGLLNDAEYARQVARSQMVGRGYAPRRLQQELARRGVARDVADRAIDLVRSEDAAPGSFGAESGVDLTETIEKLARRKLRSLGSLDAETRARRLYAFLARRGYDSHDIRSVLARLRAEERAADSA